MDEEVVLLEEQLSAAQADIEQLQVRLAEAETLAGERGTELAEIRQRAGAQTETLAAQSGEIESLRAALTESRALTEEAVSRYRQGVLEREPALPADLVTGDSVAAVDEAVARARQTVAQVRQHMEEQAQSVRVPAGAPVRGLPDTDSLTAAEKIRLGLSTSNK